VPCPRKFTIFVVLVFRAIGLEPLLAQTAPDASSTERIYSRGHHGPVTLSVEDGLSVVAVARDVNRLPGSEGDCSHLVNLVYDRAGFPYKYANSSDLYRGIESFERVRRPQPGDLVVWHGHAGIVINPRRHLFFSALRRGPGIGDYETDYWKRRGAPHFFRYIKRTDS